MTKKWDEDLSNNTVVIPTQSPVEQNAGPIDVKNSVISGSVVIPFDEYLETVGPEQIQLTKQHNVTGYPDLFTVRGLKNDKDSTVPALVFSRPVKIFTALYEAKFKSILQQTKNKVTH